MHFMYTEEYTFITTEVVMSHHLDYCAVDQVTSSNTDFKVRKGKQQKLSYIDTLKYLKERVGRISGLGAYV